MGEEEKKRVRGGGGKERERDTLKARRAGTSRLGRVRREGGGQQERDRGGGSGKGVGNKKGNVDQYGVYLPLVYLTVDPSEKERARKETGGRVGWGGSQTIFYSITA